MTEEYAELEGFDYDNLSEDESEGGVREPKKPILPFLPGNISLELEREEKFDLCICSNK